MGESEELRWEDVEALLGELGKPLLTGRRARNALDVRGDLLVRNMLGKMKKAGFDTEDGRLLAVSARREGLSLRDLAKGWDSADMAGLKPDFYWLWIQAGMYPDKPANVTRARRLIGVAGSEEIGAWAGAAGLTPADLEKMMEKGEVTVSDLTILAALGDVWVNRA